MLGQCLGEILAQCEVFSFGRLGDCIAYYLFYFYSLCSVSWFFFFLFIPYVYLIQQ
jgi:hypothetical protein